jgi:UV DNA damage endonuclease
MGLPQSAWAAINIHGGKGGRSAELVAQIKDLPDTVRLRLTLENDERAYGAQEILQVCQRAEVPMMFDAHHHLVREKLGSYEDPSIAEFVGLARQTWNPSHWQVLHISNGHEGLHDNRHHELVGIMPSAYREAQWIEVEAKGKEVAIGYLRKHWTD